MLRGGGIRRILNRGLRSATRPGVAVNLDSHQHSSRLFRNFASTSSSTEKTGKSASPQLSELLSKLPTGASSVWSVEWVEEYADTDSYLMKLTHTKSGLVHYHLHKNDPHLMMGISFKTEEFDKSGRDHLLQKILLAGSQKFPVRDSFAHMADRSLGESTSTGAWSGGEFTAFNFGSRNKTDFYNLLEVYFEALFKPRFTKADFLEEGWRMEFSTPSDSSTPLILRGREVNEARKSMIDLNQIAVEAVYSQLFLSQTEAKEISVHTSERLENLVNVDYETLVQYHRLVYHPSNMTIFTYGNANLLELTAHLDKHYLSSFSPLSKEEKQKLELALPPKQLVSLKAIDSGQTKQLSQLAPDRPQKRRQLILRCPRSQENTSVTGGGSCIGLAFPCTSTSSNQPMSQEDKAGLSILSTLLFELPGSPLFRDFLESGVASGYIPGYGFEPNMSNPYFTVGLKGIREGTEEATIEMLRFSLSQAAKEGFNELEIESLLTQIELPARTPSEDFGIKFFQSYIGPLSRRDDTEVKQAVDMHKTLRSIASKKPLTKYFQTLLRKYLLESPECLEVKIIPNAEYYDDVEIAENRIIRSKLEQAADRQAYIVQIIEDSEHLRQEKEQLQDIDCLPKLTPADFSASVQQPEKTVYKVQNVNLTHFVAETNGTTHFRVKVNVSDLDQTQIKYLDLAAKLFPNLGTFSMKPFEVLMTKQLYIADFSFQLVSESSPSDPNKPQVFVVVQGHCLDRHVEKLMEIFTGLLSGPDFNDLQNLSRLLKIEASEAANRIGASPLGYTLPYAQSSMRKPFALNNKLANVSQTMTTRTDSFASWEVSCSLR